MFHRKHYLTKDERQQLCVLKETYVAGLKERSHAPDCFEANINCLKMLRQAQALWRIIIEPYIQKEIATRKCISHYHQAMVNIKRNALNEANKKMLTHDVNKLLDRGFDREPRIIKLSYTEDFKDVTLINCSITFSDGFELKLKSLDDEIELAKAKIIFENKMRDLKIIMQESKAHSKHGCMRC